MVMYLSIVFLTILLVSLINIFCFPPSLQWTNSNALSVILIVVLSVIIEIIIDGLVSFICEKLPSAWFKADKKFMQVSKSERKFYDKLGIRHWKDKVWELGALSGFRKNKIKDAKNTEYLDRFIVESGKGLLGHILNCFFGFLVVFFLPLKYALRIGVPIAIVGAILNILPCMILRYNLPKLIIAYNRALKTNVND